MASILESTNSERDVFRYKSRKAHSTPKRTSTSLEIGDLLDVNLETSNKQQMQQTKSPSLSRRSITKSDNSVALRERSKRFKPTTSIELNIFYRRNIKPRPPIHSGSDIASIETQGYLLFKEKGKKTKKRWLTLTDDTLLCYRAITVSILFLLYLLYPNILICYFPLKSGRDNQSVTQIPLRYSVVKKENDNCFSIVTIDNAYFFQSESVNDITIWLDEISSVCSKLVMNTINFKEKSKSMENLVSVNVCSFIITIIIIQILIKPSRNRKKMKKLCGWLVQINVQIVVILVGFLIFD